jgi:predicted phosphodiesterase
MLLGLLADIHEDVEHLRQALAHFAALKVDRTIVLGDLFETGLRIEETCRLLHEAKAVGVWGNHDFGLCCDPEIEIRSRYSPAIIEFMATLQPRLEVADCQFAHIEPWLDPRKIEDLWYFEGPPREPEALSRIFGAASSRILFAGHYHRWLLATPEAITEWNGNEPVRLAGCRYFIVVGALCEGRYATFDTEAFDLCPLQLESHGY